MTLTGQLKMVNEICCQQKLCDVLGGSHFYLCTLLAEALMELVVTNGERILKLKTAVL